MSFYFVKSNNESTKDLYQKRIIYTGLIHADSPKHVVNFHLGEKLMYGRVNQLNVPISIISPNVFGGLKSFSADLCRQKNFYGLAFVVDAFYDLIKQYRYSAYNGKIKDGDEFLSEIQIYKAFVNPNDLYNKQITAYSESLQNIFRQNQTKVVNFHDFVEKFILTLESTAYRTPFTKAAFVKSRHCPINCSGLVIEIADLDPVNDDEKIQKFLSSPNWQYFVNICNQYGFMIDQFIPWRIVADIDSEGMREYASGYGATTTNKILSMMYAPAHRQNYDAFKDILLEIYNAVKKEYTKIEQCGDMPVSTIVTPTSYTIGELNATYSEQYFLKTYCKIRFLEEETRFKEFEQDILIDECQDLALSQSTTIALDYFERIINKPFDYVGSMSYIKKQVLSQIAEEEQKDRA